MMKVLGGLLTSYPLLVACHERSDGRIRKLTLSRTISAFIGTRKRLCQLGTSSTIHCRSVAVKGFTMRTQIVVSNCHCL